MRNPYIALLGTAWKYASSERKRFLLIYAMFVIANIITALNPLFYGWFIDSLQQQGTDVLRNGWTYISAFLGLRLLEWCFHGPARVMERKLAFHVARNFLEELYHKVLHMPVKWHQDNHTGSTINKLRKAHEALRDFFQQGFVYLYSFGKFIFSFGAMLYFSPLFGAIAVCIGVVTVLVIIKFDRPYIKSLREVNEREHRVSSALFDSLSNIITVISLRLEKRMKEGFISRLMDVFPPFKRNVTINEWKWFTAQMMVGIIYATITIGYVYQNWVPGETFLIGGLVILIGYVNQFTSVFNDIASQYTQITRYYTEVQNVKELENAYDLHRPDHIEGALPAEWNVVDIENLNFSRNEPANTAHTNALREIRIRLQKGKRIAFIGESGCGKSTLLAILRGLHSPNPGVCARTDAHNRLAFESLSKTITLFPQDPEIFENTIHYNITLGLSFTEEEVMQACESAEFADVVKRLPKGLHTHIQEKGVNLSGGQKQRLALARGILAAQGSEIILLDEPTSSVDPRTEKKIYKSLFKAFQHKVVVSSLHRLHLLNMFDYIYILKEGSIVDEGSFEQLSRYSLVFKEFSEHHGAEAITAGESQISSEKESSDPDPAKRIA